MDEAAQKLHGGERHTAARVAMRVVLVGEGHVLAIEGEQSVIADRHAMGVAPEVSEDGHSPTEGWLGVDDPVGLEERIDEGPPRRRIRRYSLPPARSSSLRSYARRNGKIDFLTQLEEVCQRTTAAERKGRPGVLLRTVPPAVPDDLYSVDGWKFPKRHLTILFGPGGTMKSYLALWALGTLAFSGVRVGFVDWELAAEDHSLRERLLFGLRRPDIHYLRAERPLVHELSRIQHWKAEHDLEYLGLDSVAYGTAGKPEDAEQAMAYNRAYRSLDVGGLAIAHVRKDGTNPTDADKFPFGSVFWNNSARCTWFVKEAEGIANDATTKTIGLFNRKMNLSGRLPAVGFAINFDPDRTVLSRVDVRDVQDLAESLPLWQRIREAVRLGPQTIAAIANELNHPNVESIDRIVRRQKGVFTKITGPDGIHRVALVERRAS